MIKGIYTSAAGMIARQTELEAVSNNLANVNTTGYKADRRLFRATITGELLQGKSPDWRADNAPFYEINTDFTAGALTQTGNPLDIAIGGKGFFAVETEAGVAYTRNGNFSLNADNELINAQGHRMLGESGPIRIDGKQVAVAENGDLFVDGVNAGRLMVVDFAEPYKLKRMEGGYFVPEEGTEAIPAEAPRLQQGRIESANIDPVAEMVRMIELNRAFESCQKAVQAQDETLKLAVSEIAR